MARPQKRYRLWKKDKKTYYYKLPGQGWKTTGHSKKTDAQDFADDRYHEWLKSPAARNWLPSTGNTLRDFIAPYYKWDECPRIADRLLEGKRISKHHAQHQRALINNYILEDELADRNIHKITRGDIKAFRRRLAESYHPRTVNAVLAVLKTVFLDGFDRELLKSNPTKTVGKLQYIKRESGVFSEAEIKKLFPAKGRGPWLDIQDFSAFLIAATTGMRRGEILALCWKDIDFEKMEIHVRQAWKSDTELGEPKWGQKRSIPLPHKVSDKLRLLRRKSEHVLPDSLVFHNPDGSRKGSTWWNSRFSKAMKNAKINAKDRYLTGHSFRHSLNTLLRAKGYSDEKIRATLGWTNPKTQADYTHWNTDHLREQAEIVDGLLS
jgi:integrase